MTLYNKKPSLHKCINEIFMCAMNCFIGLVVSFYIEDASTKTFQIFGYINPS
jgi:hypothetical protein